MASTLLTWEYKERDEARRGEQVAHTGDRSFDDVLKEGTIISIDGDHINGEFDWDDQINSVFIKAEEVRPGTF